MTDEPEYILAKLGKELRQAGAMLDRDQARFLVTFFYQVQEHRIALGNQMRSLTAAGKPVDVVEHFATQMSTLEKQMVGVLDTWTMTSEAGRWARSQTGVGPIITAALLAHIDIEKAPSASHIIRFAGLDPKFLWLGREKAHALVQECLLEFPVKRGEQWTPEMIDWVCAKANRKPESLTRLASRKDGKLTTENLERALSLRPWNAELKLVQWKLGKSFTLTSNSENSFYGKLYRQRKALETENNNNLMYKDQAAESLRTKKFGPSETRDWYEKGMLPPGRIDLRAQRWAVTKFLSHLHHVMYVERYGEPPAAPYALSQLGHVDYMPPPNYDGPLPKGVDVHRPRVETEPAGKFGRRVPPVREMTDDDYDEALADGRMVPVVPRSNVVEIADFPVRHVETQRAPKPAEKASKKSEPEIKPPAWADPEKRAKKRAAAEAKAAKAEKKSKKTKE